MIIVKDKLKAIYFLYYPKILEVLEYYLGLTGYLKGYIYFYAQLAEPLQALKTIFLKRGLISKASRQAFTSKTKLLL